MKFNAILLSTFFGITMATALSGCLRDECSSKRSFVRYDPIYKTVSECRVGISVQAPREMRKPGKIYALGNFLFINEKQEGIHVVDNSNPANPQKIAFWSIPGNVDMAIRNNILYADQYIDLLTIDINDIQNPQVVCRSENAFPLFGFDPYRGILVDYQKTNITEEVDCDQQNNWFRRDDVLFLEGDMANENYNGNSPSIPAGAGIGGSYARFTLFDEYLYTVDNNWLRSWSVASPCASRLDSVLVGWNIETIFPWKNRLFVGSQTGVFIFNNTNPAHPVLETSFSHATGCDPVVCDDKYAYVTIHDGTNCNGTLNQLDVIGIEHLPATALLKTYQMKRPFGLSITPNFLFLCDDGLKIFDKSNPLQVKELSHLKAIEAYDVIALDEQHLLLIGDGGFYQFDVSNPRDPKQISHLPVVK
ncbi:MAG: LVIVD repeat-containing protein [Saprospiraceae bacterium]